MSQGEPGSAIVSSGEPALPEGKMFILLSDRQQNFSSEQSTSKVLNKKRYLDPFLTMMKKVGRFVIQKRPSEEGRESGDTHSLKRVAPFHCSRRTIFFAA